MSAPIHPIRKLLKVLDLYNAATAPASDRDIYQRAVALHIRPLLDAVESLHSHAFDHAAGTAPNCPECRLLAAWRAKL